MTNKYVGYDLLVQNVIFTNEEQKHVTHSQTYDTHDDTYTHHLLLVNQACCMS